MLASAGPPTVEEVAKLVEVALSQHRREFSEMIVAALETEQAARRHEIEQLRTFVQASHAATKAALCKLAGSVLDDENEDLTPPPALREEPVPQPSLEPPRAAEACATGEKEVLELRKVVEELSGRLGASLAASRESGMTALRAPLSTIQENAWHQQKLGEPQAVPLDPGCPGDDGGGLALRSTKSNPEDAWDGLGFIHDFVLNFGAGLERPEPRPVPVQARAVDVDAETMMNSSGGGSSASIPSFSPSIIDTTGSLKDLKRMSSHSPLRHTLPARDLHARHSLVHCSRPIVAPSGCRRGGAVMRQAKGSMSPVLPGTPSCGGRVLSSSVSASTLVADSEKRRVSEQRSSLGVDPLRPADRAACSAGADPDLVNIGYSGATTPVGRGSLTPVVPGDERRPVRARTSVDLGRLSPPSPMNCSPLRGGRSLTAPIQSAGSSHVVRSVSMLSCSHWPAA